VSPKILTTSMTTMKWSNVANICLLNNKNTFSNLFENYKDLFSDKLGLIPGPTVNLRLKPNSKPYYAKAYNIPQAIISIAQKEINDLEDLQVINTKCVFPMGCSTSFSLHKRWWCSLHLLTSIVLINVLSMNHSLYQ
jgi:hypothetical protein